MKCCVGDQRCVGRPVRAVRAHEQRVADVLQEEVQESIVPAHEAHAVAHRHEPQEVGHSELCLRGVLPKLALDLGVAENRSRHVRGRRVGVPRGEGGGAAAQLVVGRRLGSKETKAGRLTIPADEKVHGEARRR